MPCASLLFRSGAMTSDEENDLEIFMCYEVTTIKVGYNMNSWLLRESASRMVLALGGVYNIFSSILSILPARA